MSVTGISLRRRASFGLAITFGLVALADFLFYGHPLGWNTALFGSALIAAVMLRDGRALRTWLGRGLAAACGGLLVALAIEPGPLPIILGLLALISLAILDRNGLSAAAALWLSGWARFLIRGIAQPFRDARLGQRRQRARGIRHPLLITTVRWIIPVLLSLTFVGLFTLANPIIADWTADLPELFAPRRIGLWLIVGLCAWALLRTRLGRTPKRTARPTGTHDHFRRLERDTGSTWITRSLVLFNAVFAVQTVLDLFYLYGGAALPEGMTYAEYAHRGAYPLIATALLAGLFVLITFRPGGPAERSAWARRLVFLWIAQNVLLVVSSVWRLSLYVDVYSLTRWRVAAGVWMTLVALALVLLVVRIATRRDNRWLVQANTLMAAAVLYACCFVGFDRWIADYNVRHCREIVAQQPDAPADLLNAPLDIAYLQRLGPDALPALRHYLAQTDDANHPTTRRIARHAIHHAQTQLDHHLADWRGWTIRRLTLAGVR